MRKKLANLCLVTFFLGMLIAACDVTTPVVPLPQPSRTPTVSSEEPVGDWISVYFTDPQDSQADTLRGGPDAELAAAIDQARVSVDVAIFDLNLWSVRDALLNAAKRGVEVRIVTETDNLDEPEMQQLIQTGLMVVDDQRENLMHNKFAIIDQSEVWTGSMNYTTSDAYKNNNNLVRLRSSRLAQAYTAEFDEMFEQKLFGSNKSSHAEGQDISMDGTRIEVYFSPQDNTAHRLVELIQGAGQSIDFLAYSFTSDDLANAMLARAAEGVTVSGVFETSQYNSNVGTEFDRMLDAGLEVRLDGNSRNMHDKVIIIDEQIVITGSYNFSSNAENRNDENTLIIHDPDVARLYLEEFRNLFAQAQK